jgi:hypothetical protein
LEVAAAAVVGGTPGLNSNLVGIHVACHCAVLACSLR